MSGRRWTWLAALVLVAVVSGVTGFALASGSTPAAQAAPATPAAVAARVTPPAPVAPAAATQAQPTTPPAYGPGGPGYGYGPGWMMGLSPDQFRSLASQCVDTMERWLDANGQGSAPSQPQAPSGS
ncbi:MAG: hypothetical protein K6U79_08885 [Firmicutes bacterium]|nr:hypothetical protein [Bacillota bacterium]